MSSTVNIRELPMFILGIALLCIMLYCSYAWPSLQFNIIWLVFVSLNAAIIMAFLPFSGEFTIPGWAKFGGSAAVFIGCMYFTFDIAAKNLQKENIEIRAQMDALGKQNATIQNSLQTCTSELHSRATENHAPAQSLNLTPSINNIVASLQATKGYIAESARHAYGATTNTSDVRGCVAAANLALQAANTATNQINTTEAAVNALPRSP